ncbi:hypothetical protein KEM55_006476, partial [Ascosphaera atra]
LSAGYHQTSPRRPVAPQPGIPGTTTCSAQQFPPEKYQTCPPIRECNGQVPLKTMQNNNANSTIQPPMSLQDLFNRFGNQSGSTKPSEAKKSYFPGDWTPPLGNGPRYHKDGGPLQSRVRRRLQHHQQQHGPPNPSTKTTEPMASTNT